MGRRYVRLLNDGICEQSYMWDKSYSRMEDCWANGGGSRLRRVVDAYEASFMGKRIIFRQETCRVRVKGIRVLNTK